MKHGLIIAGALLLSGAAVAQTAGVAVRAAASAPMAAEAGHARVLPLQGGRNFRDLGGYATASGKHVRWGTLFRSGSMAGLTAADYAYLNRLGIAYVCDLRSAPERQAEPTMWQGNPKLDYWTTDIAVASSKMSRDFAAGFSDGAKARATMIALYRDIPATYAPAYRVIFRHLAAGELPLAFNCTAGKDRTGVAAALILSALGVPRATIVQDYMLSDKVLDPAKMQASAALSSMGKLPPAAAAALLRSDPAYIEAALDAIDARYGSVEGYLRTALGLSAADIAAMRARLLV